MRIIENPELFRSNIVLKFEEFIHDESQSKNLEIGTYNWCIKEATNNKIIKYWCYDEIVELLNKYDEQLCDLFVSLNRAYPPSFRRKRSYFFC